MVTMETTKLENISKILCDDADGFARSELDEILHTCDMSIKFSDQPTWKHCSVWSTSTRVRSTCVFSAIARVYCVYRSCDLAQRRQISRIGSLAGFG